MIVRVWHGQTKVEHFEAYTEFLKGRAIPDYQQTEGFVKLSFLRRIVGDTAHFTLLTYWKNLEVIKNFAGEAYELAKYYPEDQEYLLKFEEKVTHYEVFA
ncbi:MAG: antibiotic biosynthesis monooxygenase [Bacteroidota bacterium]